MTTTSHRFLRRSVLLNGLFAVEGASMFLLDVVLAAALGLGSRSDSLYAAWSLPLTIGRGAFQSLTNSLIGLFAEAEDDNVAYSQSVTVIGVLSLAAAALMSLTSRWWFPLSVPGADAATRQAGVPLAAILAWLIALLALAETQRAIYYRLERVTFPSLTRVFGALAAIVLILLAARQQNLTLAAYGLVLGAAVEMLLGFAGLLWLGVRPRLAWPPAALIAAGLVGSALLVSYGLWNPNLQSALALYQNDLQTMLWLLAGAWAAIWLRDRWPRARSVGDWLLVGLVFVNLLWYGSSFNPVGKIRNLMPDTATIDYLQEHAGLERVVGVQRNGETLFGANLLSLHGLREPGGYSSLVSARLHALIAQDDPEIDNTWMNRQTNMVLFSRPSDRLLDLFSVRLLASPEVIFDPGPVAEIVNDACATHLALTATQPITGSFEVWRTAINRIDLRFAPDAARPGDGQVRFRLWRDGPGGTLIAESALAAADIAATPQQTIYLAPEEHAPGRTYAWELALEGTDAGELLLCADAAGTPTLSVFGAQLAEVNQADGVYTYRRLAPFYRASVVYGAESIAEDAAAIARALDAEFDLCNTAITATPVELPAVAPIPATEAVIEHYANDEVRIRATAQQAGLLVLTDLYYPGWVATVDGTSAEILRVNHVLRGVLLPPGEHEVVFRYAPRAVQIGAVISALSLALAVGIIGLAWIKRGRGEG